MGKIIYLAAIQEKKEGAVLPELMIEDKRGYEDMPQNAEDILALYANNQYPVPVIGIAKKFGFKVFDTDLQDNQLSGFIVVDPKWKDVYGSEKIIMVNKNDSSGHKRFTIAHELAHFLFDRQGRETYYNTYNTEESPWKRERSEADDREMVANYFAANLLMPSLDFKRKYQQLREKGGFLSRDEIVAELATFFGVPETSVKIRFEELGLN